MDNSSNQFGNFDENSYGLIPKATFKNPIAMTDTLAFNGQQANIIVGDFNGDGKDDVIRQEFGNSVDGYRDTEVYLSQGDGIFANPIAMTDTLAFNGQQANIIVGDFNGDGKDDLIRQEFGSSVDGYRDTEVYLSQGDGLFANPIAMTDTLAFNGQQANIIVGDFNGDGKDDLIRQEFGSSVDGYRDTEVYLSNSDGLFANPIAMTDTLAFNGQQANIIVGDFNGDGKDDLIRQEFGSSADGYRDTEVYLSNGDGTFANPLPMTDSGF
ncbi:VCBS repeat-containing protein [Nodularia sp. LEGE 06071]|uniref:FG-GAP repeat domain-containing protein n=1 Tax=Nodularia sp. LEGE 06071 TaxID=2777965 RepID=UPI00187ED23A|nr:VCBS repeat-containing protein [Nodularia sp. LEGE 06071]MBE9199791.1 VCBS repeat-containing protein [Nodularia sp. LEGE 06071]